MSAAGLLPLQEQALPPAERQSQLTQHLPWHSSVVWATPGQSKRRRRLTTPQKHRNILNIRIYIPTSTGNTYLICALGSAYLRPGSGTGPSSPVFLKIALTMDNILPTCQILRKVSSRTCACQSRSFLTYCIRSSVEWKLKSSTISFINVEFKVPKIVLAM
jgi:hypothetical protein